MVLPKENHMQSAEAATLDRKSGEAEGSAVRPSGFPNSGVLTQTLRPWLVKPRYMCNPGSTSLFTF